MRIVIIELALQDETQVVMTKASQSRRVLQAIDKEGKTHGA